MSEQRLTIGIVGMGPRGLSTLERLCAGAAEQPSTRVTVHVVDPGQPGSGSVWRTDQSRHLLMNTVASQISLFTDESVEMEGPLDPGPTLYEWAQLIALWEPGEEFGAEVIAEARRIAPNTYPTRAFYGNYLEWVYARVIARAPGNVTVRPHRSRAVSLADASSPDGPQTLLLEDGTVLDGLDGVVLTLGHVPAETARETQELETFAGRHGLRLIAPVNPADVDLDAVAPGEGVILRGLGLNFFDYMALFTLGRGGVFEEAGDGLRYRPSGREPRLYAGSRRGIPYHARGENEKGPHGRHLPVVLTPAKLEQLRQLGARSGGLDFRRDLWPLVALEVETLYYTTLLARTLAPVAVEGFRERFLATAPESRERRALLGRFGIAEEEFWDWERLSRPHDGLAFDGPEAFRAWLLRLLRADVEEALAGNVSGPLKAALDALRDLRNELRVLVDHGGLTADSHRDHLDRWYTPLNAFLSIGPPARRIQEMIALIEAGVLDLLGPDMTVETDAEHGVFTAFSPRVPGSRVEARTLIEARLPDIDLRTTQDPLLLQLLMTGGCAPYVVHGPGQEPHRTGGLAVTERPYRLIDAEGRAHPRRFAFGVPTESVHWVTAAGIRPGVNSVTLGDSDAVARAALALTPAEVAVTPAR